MGSSSSPDLRGKEPKWIKERRVRVCHKLSERGRGRHTWGLKKKPNRWQRSRRWTDGEEPVQRTLSDLSILILYIYAISSTSFGVCLCVCIKKEEDEDARRTNEKERCVDWEVEPVFTTAVTGRSQISPAYLSFLFSLFGSDMSTSPHTSFFLSRFLFSFFLFLQLLHKEKETRLVTVRCASSSSSQQPQQRIA